MNRTPNLFDSFEGRTEPEAIVNQKSECTKPNRVRETGKRKPKKTTASNKCDAGIKDENFHPITGTNQRAKTHSGSPDSTQTRAVGPTPRFDNAPVTVVEPEIVEAPTVQTKKSDDQELRPFCVDELPDAIPKFVSDKVVASDCDESNSEIPLTTASGATNCNRSQPYSGAFMKITFNGHEYEIQNAHQAANCLPWNLEDKDFSELIDSVRTNYDPEKPVIIQASTGLVVSGRRRLLACKIADVQPETRTVDWDDEKICEWVKSDELIRRNLTKGQRASALLKLSKLNKHGGNRKNQDLPGSLDPTKSLHQIAKESNISKSTVERVAQLKKKDLLLLSCVEEGKLTPKTANACLKLSEEDRKEIAQADVPKAVAKKKLKSIRKKKPTVPPADDELSTQPETIPAPPVGKLETYYRNDGIPDLPGVYRPRFMRATNGQEVALDAYGTPASPSNGDTFADTELRQLYYDLNALAENGESLLKQFEKLKASNKTHQVYTWVNIPEMRDLFEKFRNTAVELSDHVLGGIPYAVCPDCHGERKGCKSCRSSGYWPKSECDVYPNRFRKAGAA